MRSYSYSWAKFIIRNRLKVVWLSLLALIVSIFSIYNFPIRYDNSFEMFMLEGDPNIKRFDKFRDLFGDAEYLSIGIEARSFDTDIFESETIRMINEISEMLEDHEYVSKVSSLSNYQYTHSFEGMVVTDNLFDEPSLLNKESVELSIARTKMRDESPVIRSFLTSDFRHTRILARTEYIRNQNAHKIKISNDIYSFLKKKNYESKGYKLRLGGGAIISERFETLSKRDSYFLNPIVAIIMCLVIYFMFGTFLACLLPWFLIITSVTILCGIQAILGFPMTIVNSALLPTLMIIGMGVSIHIMTDFFSSRVAGRSPVDSGILTIENLLKPIFFTALTTAIGFSALSITELIPVKHYALLAALGSMIIFLVSTTFFVSVLSFFDYYPTNYTKTVLCRFVSSLTCRVTQFCSSYRWYVTLATSALILFCLITVPKISVDSNIYNYFKSNNWLNEDMRYFDMFYKAAGIELVIDSGRDNGIKDPRFLHKVELLEIDLNQLDETGQVISAIDLLKRLRKALNQDEEAFFLLPDSSNMTAQLLLMYANSGPADDLSDSIDFDNRFLRLSVPISNMSAEEFSNFYDNLQINVSKEHANLSVEYTGPLVLYNAQETYINSGLKKSFSLALLMVGLSFFVLFKSFKYGFIALFPSVLPILVVAGGTVLFNLALDLGTIIVGAMCMGIAVDDAIHVMSRYLKAKREGCDTECSLEYAMKSSGRAVIFTSLILIFGFSAMVFASLVPTILFGIFSALIMVLALFGDIIILPALILIFDRDLPKRKSRFSA